MTRFPGLRLVDYRDLPDGPWNPAAITDTGNALGSRPPRILYLWIFARPQSLCGQLVTHGWTFVGPVHLLVSPAARIPIPIARSARAVGQALRTFRYAAGDYRCPKLIDYEYRATYHGYPINCLWCSDTAWTAGFEAMAGRSERFVMDLSTDEPPEGLITEIAYLLRRVPLEKVVFLLDSFNSDTAVVEDFLRVAWDAMPANAVNAGHRKPVPVICYRSTAMAYMAQATMGLWTGRGAVPLARRAAHFSRW